MESPLQFTDELAFWVLWGHKAQSAQASCSSYQLVITAACSVCGIQILVRPSDHPDLNNSLVASTIKCNSRKDASGVTAGAKSIGPLARLQYYFGTCGRDAI